MLLGAASSKLPAASTVTLYYDADLTVPTLLNDLWLPNIASADLAHNRNTTDSLVAVSTNTWTFTLPGTDANVYDNANLQFILVVPDGATGLPCVNVTDLQDPRTAVPWKLMIQDMHTQTGNVTFMKNVINPAQGEKVKVHYTLGTAGPVTIHVFDLKGDVVDVLYNGYQAAGEHSTTWNGKNRGGRTVARGVYFIKLVAPGIEEIREVLVAK
jgi:hypothetical protein